MAERDWSGGRSPAQNRRLARVPERIEEPKGAYELLMEAERNQRVGNATPIEREVYDILGMEPGLDRANLLPIAGSRSQGNLQFAAPGFIYDLAKAAVTPGAAAKGEPVSNEDVLNVALNTMGGGLAMSSPVEGAIAGMAVKNKGGVFYPRNVGGSRLDGYISRLPEDLQDRARRYLTTTYGTADDPLRLALLEGRIKRPEGFRDYLLEAARRDYADRGAASRTRGEPISEAMQDFEARYDDLTGISSTLYGPEPAYSARAGITRPKIDDPLRSSGVPDELINPGYITFEDPQDKILKVRSNIAENPNSLWRQEELRKYEELLGITDNPDRTLATAVEKGDVIYDVTPGLQFLDRRRLARGLTDVPEDKLAKMSFPEAVVVSEKNLARFGNLDAAVNRASSGKAVPLRMWLNEGVRPVTSVADSQWVRITDPEYMRLESAHMGHSVKGYADKGNYGVGSGGRDAILDGTAQVYSLRDSKTGLPRITVEVEATPGEPPNVAQIKGKQNKPPEGSDFESIFKLFDELGFDENTKIYERAPDTSTRERWNELYRNYRQSKPERRAKGGMINAPTETPANYSKGRWRLI